MKACISFEKVIRNTVSRQANLTRATEEDIMTLERILQAAKNSMINGHHAPHCYRAHVVGRGYVNDGSAVFDRADYLAQLARDVQSEIDNIGFASKYGERGYDQPKRGVVFANWNRFPSDFDSILENAGYAVEWADEWTTCDNCGNVAFRTQPDSHDWKPAYHQDANGNIYCDDCTLDSDDDDDDDDDEPIEHYDGDSGAHLLTMPRECAEDCSRPGAMDEPVAYWRTRVTWVADERTLRRSLKSFGAWDDLDTADLDIIKDRVLWCAACDWREEHAQSRRT
jgi:hypothetical protein